MLLDLVKVIVIIKTLDTQSNFMLLKSFVCDCLIQIKKKLIN